MDERTDPARGDENAPQLPVPRTGDDGKPIYDQEFFLALARRGKDEWNRWCEERPGTRVTFAGVDFRAAAHGDIDFSGFEFGHHADLSACRFSSAPDLLFGERAFKLGTAKFSGATFGDGADLSGAIFEIRADLSGATFGDRANLSGAIFGIRANLSGAIFGIRTNLSGVTFEYGADLSDATFGIWTDLSGATFGNHTDLAGATFGYGADLSRVTFTGFADLRSHSIDDWKQARAKLIQITPALQSWPQERRRAFVTPAEHWTGPGPGPDAFVDIKFSNARFFGVANFTGRRFKDRCDLTGARFHQPPSFDAGDRLDRLDLYGARIGFAGRVKFLGRIWRCPGWTTDSEVANQLRRLRDLADTTKNHDLERDLYIEERKAERGILLAQYWRGGRRSFLKPRLYSHCLWIAVMAAYSLFADYGRSFVRPLAALFASAFVFHAVYWMVLEAPSGPSHREEFRRAVWAFSIASAVPFVGALSLEQGVKLQLFCQDRPRPCPAVAPGTSFQVVALGQSIFSALCIFFAGLALRNYFKLR
jgi:uncharacterized protein YjbI with pentapeptide repeats